MSCSQNLRTIHPLPDSSRLLRRSLSTLPEIFFRQNAAFVEGWTAC